VAPHVTELFQHIGGAGIAINVIYGITASKQKRRIFRKLKRLTVDEIIKMVGPVDFAKARYHESLLWSQRASLLSHHPTLQLPPDLETLREQIKNPGGCREYAKYQLLLFLGVEIPDMPFTPVPDLDELINERFPLARYLTHAETEDVQRYINLVEQNR
jgi:hypothetical protein